MADVSGPPITISMKVMVKILREFWFTDHAIIINNSYILQQYSVPLAQISDPVAKHLVFLILGQGKAEATDPGSRSPVTH